MSRRLLCREARVLREESQSSCKYPHPEQPSIRIFLTWWQVEPNAPSTISKRTKPRGETRLVCFEQHQSITHWDLERFFDENLSQIRLRRSRSGDLWPFIILRISTNGARTAFCLLASRLSTLPSISFLFDGPLLLMNLFHTKGLCRILMLRMPDWTRWRMSLAFRKGRSISTSSGVAKNFSSAPFCSQDIFSHLMKWDGKDQLPGCN